eukprot:jgi/Ulvmu1/10170/UM006_0125.1
MPSACHKVVVEHPCCPVSCEPYETEGPHRPVMLPCGHTISFTSLQAILSQPEDRRLCPFDRSPLAAADSHTYPLNFAVIDMLCDARPQAYPSLPPPQSAPLPRPPPKPTDLTTSPSSASPPSSSSSVSSVAVAQASGSRPLRQPGRRPPQRAAAHGRGRQRREARSHSPPASPGPSGRESRSRRVFFEPRRHERRRRWTPRLERAEAMDIREAHPHAARAAPVQEALLLNLDGPPDVLPHEPPDAAGIEGLSAIGILHGRRQPEVMPEEQWELLTSRFKICPANIQGEPGDWPQIGRTAGGMLAYSSSLRTNSGTVQIALCHVASFQSPALAGPAPAPAGAPAEHRETAEWSALLASVVVQAALRNTDTVKAAVLPHVGLHLLPDLRSLLPQLYGFVIYDVPHPGRRAEQYPRRHARGAPIHTQGDGAMVTQVFVAYEVRGESLAAYLRHLRLKRMDCSAVGSIMLQLSSGLACMHAHDVTSHLLHPLCLDSVCVYEAPEGPLLHITPYARSHEMALPMHTWDAAAADRVSALCCPPEAFGAPRVMFLCDRQKADVWRAAALAATALLGLLQPRRPWDPERRVHRLKAPADLAELVQEVQCGYPPELPLPPGLACLLRGCLDKDPEKRWSAEHAHALLLTAAEWR